MNTKNTRAMSVEPDPHAELAVQGDAGLAAPVAYKDCPHHSWLIDPGHRLENDPCPECEGERLRAIEQRTFTAADIRKAFLDGSQWAIRAVASESDTAPEAAADTYLASL